MKKEHYVQSLKLKKKAVILIISSTVVLSLILSLIQPFEYRAAGQVLVIRKQSGSVDAYTAVKSADKIAKGLTTIVYSSSFMDYVFSAGFNIDQSQFSSQEDKRRKEWKKSVNAYVIPDTGLIKIEMYNKDKDQANKIARAIIYVLTTASGQYHGGGKEVEVKTIDTPLVSKYPVRPNLPVNVGLGFILGVILASVYIYLKFISIPNPKNQIHSAETKPIDFKNNNLADIFSETKQPGDSMNKGLNQFTEAQNNNLSADTEQESDDWI